MMHVSLYPFLYLWIALAAAVLALFGYRQKLARGEDDTLHVLHGSAPSVQASLAAKLDQVDKWGKLLTVITVVFGILVGALAILQNFYSPTISGT